MRDRLVKLIDDFCRDKYVEKYIPTQEAYDFFIATTAFADYLLANGVIVPPGKVGLKRFVAHFYQYHDQPPLEEQINKYAERDNLTIITIAPLYGNGIYVLFEKESLCEIKTLRNKRIQRR